MILSPLDQLCQHHGIAIRYDDPNGGERAVPDATKRLILDRIGIDPDARPQGNPAPQRISAPQGVACHCPAWLEQAPAWGMFCQLYELRSERNWGIGDFGDLARLARILGAAGADFLGVNPLHALFLARPSRRSPFSPSSRRFLNPLYIAMDDLPGGVTEPGVLAELRAADIIDYDLVAETKLSALREIHDATPFGPGRHARAAFQAFWEAGGEALERHAAFDALSRAMLAQGHGEGWHSWPEEFRDTHSATVADFCALHAEDIRFHVWLQWIADLQLAAARDAAVAAGMRIGLYLDLAVGEAPDGSATWSAPDMILQDLSVGAPPDIFAVEGQNWGLSVPSPSALAAQDFAPFREMIAAQLAHAGALRIDHAMALWQLFLIPTGAPPTAGAHLRYPFADLLRTLAEESQRGQAVVIGEDLGFVPPGFRKAMEQAKLLSYRILYFEQNKHGFTPPTSYPAIALACLSTHDLPTLARWWQGADLALRRKHGLMETEDAAEQDAHRARERAALLRALRQAELLEDDIDAGAPDMPEAVLIAAYRFIAATPCLLAGVRLADLAGPTDPTNLPGTMDEYPNWSLRSPTSLDALARMPAFQAVTQAMRAARPRR